MGWGLGANDTANVFGTAVSSRMVKYTLAIWLTALFVIIGAICEGARGIDTLSNELRRETSFTNASPQNQEKIDSKARRTAIIISFSAALAVILLTLMKLPVSTSQAVVGAIAGVGILQSSLNTGSLLKIIICWIGTPVGGMFFTLIFYFIFRAVIRKLNMPVFVYDPVMSILLIVTGCYGAYALGANNVANVGAIFVGHNMLTAKQAAIFGGFTIAFGVLTYAKPVMMTVGKSIVKLDAFSAFTCVFSQALTVHIYAIIGVPVSTTQAIIGAILGIGIIKGGQTINFKKLTQVSIGWIATPLIAALLGSLLYFIVHLTYMPD
jgi:PiT family inorganic phosphate transporter